MRNTGELTLSLPKLGDDWQWNFTTKEFQDYKGDVLELTVKAERGIWIGEKGGIYPSDSIHGMPVYLRSNQDYDDIITTVQGAVDDVHERLLEWNTEFKTPADALKHIHDTFAHTDSVTKALHLYDNGNV